MMDAPAPPPANAALPATKATLGDLISFPTVSSESNLALITYAADLLSDAGARISLHRDGSGEKANLFATLGPDGDGGIVLSGHSDVVPVEGQDWTSDPFVMVERDGRLYGRGACDMKGFIACALSLCAQLADRELRRPLHVALTYDEEVGCFGARALVRELETAGARPAAAIIGEPTELRIIDAHKGDFEYTTEFVGLEGHASTPQHGVNAVEYAVRFVSRLMALREELKNSTPTASRFDPPFTTLQIGRIEGGIAHNVIPGHARVDWEMRPVQAADADYVKRHINAYVTEELLPDMQAVFPASQIVTHVIGEIEGLEPASESEARAIAQALTGRADTGVMSFGTEAGLFQRAGISTVVCGPGSIEQAHKPDEFIAIDQLDACLAMLEKLAGSIICEQLGSVPSRSPGRTARQDTLGAVAMGEQDEPS